jgi:hypothetical protein
MSSSAVTQTIANEMDAERVKIMAEQLERANGFRTNGERTKINRHHS